MDTKIKKFFAGLPLEKRKLAMVVRELVINSDKKISEDIKWGYLTFLFQGHLAIVYTFKNVDYINVGFIKAVRLSDPKELFEGTGKSMRHLKIKSEKDIPKSQLKKWIKEAMKLNDEKSSVQKV